jgi:hypothetical protein
METVKRGQVWLYQRDDNPSCRPVVHVITKVDGEICESTSVFVPAGEEADFDGKAHEHCTISGTGCGGIGMKRMLEGRDGAGTWRRLR